MIECKTHLSSRQRKKMTAGCNEITDILKFERGHIMGTITQLAQGAIEIAYFTPEECLSYLNDESNWNGVSKKLIQEMNEHLGLNEDADALVEILREKMAALDGLEKSSAEYGTLKTNVYRWLKKNQVPGEIKKSGEDYAMKICFALGFNVLPENYKSGKSTEEIETITHDRVSSFLRKGCRRSSFNFRDAYDTIYFYCLMNGEPYSKAKELIKRYNDSAFKCPKIKFEPYHATKTLKQTFLADNAFEDEEEFIHTMCANKHNFIGYSTTLVDALKEHYRKVCRLAIESFMADDIEDIVDNPDCVPGDEKRVLASFFSKIAALPNAPDDFKTIIKEWEYNKKWRDSDSSKPQILNLYEKHAEWIWDNDDLSTEQLSKVIPERILLRSIVSFADEQFTYKGNGKKDNYFAALKDSELSDKQYGVFDKIPNTVYLTDFVKLAQAPKEARKILILYAFVLYVNEKSIAKLDVGPNFFYHDFFELLTQILDDCGLPFLYPADPFDWLILKSIRALDQTDDNTDTIGNIIDPLDFFQEVLLRSLNAFEE